MQVAQDQGELRADSDKLARGRCVGPDRLTWPQCDRGHPCGNCVKKGLSADQCHVDSLLPDFIARTVDLTTAVARIAAIEQYLSLLPSTLPPFVVVALPAGLIPRAGPVEATAVRMTPSTSFANEEETFSDTEVAAIQLEAFVKGPPQQAEGLSNSQSAGGSSIMAVERPVLVSTSRVHLNVEWDATSTQVKDAQRRAIRKVYRTLPTTPEISYLVDLFFSRVSLFHSIHEPTFRSELEIFSAMGPGRELEVDPLFFALVGRILRCGRRLTSAAVNDFVCLSRSDSLEHFLCPFTRRRPPRGQERTSLPVRPAGLGRRGVGRVSQHPLGAGTVALVR